MFEREQVSNGFKRILLDLGVSPPPPPQLHFQKHKNVPELALFEARPSYRQQPMHRESAFILRSRALGMREFQLKNDRL